MPIMQKFRENWVRPALFFGNNPVSLAGGAITTADFDGAIERADTWLSSAQTRRSRFTNTSFAGNEVVSLDVPSNVAVDRR